MLFCNWSFKRVDTTLTFPHFNFRMVKGLLYMVLTSTVFLMCCCGAKFLHHASPVDGDLVAYHFVHSVFIDSLIWIWNVLFIFLWKKKYLVGIIFYWEIDIWCIRINGFCKIHQLCQEPHVPHLVENTTETRQHLKS